MKTFKLMLAPVALCLSATTTLAANGDTRLTVTGKQPDDPWSIRVPYDDLSLARESDAAMLRTRVERETRRVCGALYDATTPAQRWACEEIASQAAAPQIAAAIERARSGPALAGRAVVVRFARR